MRRRPSPLLVPLLVPFLAALLAPGADPAAAAGPRLAAHVGFNASDLHQDDLTSDARFGPAIGAGAHWPVGQDGWLVGVEAWYQTKGFRRGTFLDQIDMEYRARTVTVPVLLSYEFLGTRADVRAFAGVAADVVLASEFREPDDDAWRDVTDEDESLAWSLVLGGAVRVLGRWDLDVRYQHGLSELTTFDWTALDDRLSAEQAFDPATESTWTFTLGAWF
jgi:hypothetical protein